MLIPCEVTIKYFIPATRARVAKLLSKKYNLSQLEIASKLGITQAAVSKYLRSKYSSEIKKLENRKFVKEISLNLASSLAREKYAEIEFRRFCKYCRLMSKKIKCEVAKAI